MTMVIDEKTLGIWFVPIKPNAMSSGEGDWLGSLRKEDDHYEMKFRYRWYDPAQPDPWAGGDRKTWYNVRLNHTNPDDAIMSARLMVKVVLDAQSYGGVTDLPESTELLMDERGHENLLERLLEQDFASAQAHRLQ
jgi:hypothetical protein